MGLKLRDRYRVDLPGLQALLDQFREIYNTQRIHSAKKTTPYAAYNAAPKDTPGPLAPATTRFRTDKIDATGKVTLRYDGQLFHIGIGRAHARTHVVLIVEDREITIVAKATGEILRELTLDPTRKYQPQRKTPRTGGSGCFRCTETSHCARRGVESQYLVTTCLKTSSTPADPR